MGKKNNQNTKLKKNSMPKISVSEIAILLLLLISIVLFKGQFPYIIKWYIMLIVIGVPTIPLLSVFSDFYDKGYVFSKILSLSLAAMLLYILSSFRIMRFTTLNCFVVLILLGLICYGGAYYFRYKKGQSIITLDKSDIPMIIKQEAIILGILVLMMYLRGFNPAAYGTEKFMDYGFLTSILRTDYFPPEDFWYSGTNLNYYYLGQYFTAFMTKVSFNVPQYSYNLCMGAVCALSFVETFSIASTLMSTRISGADDENKKVRAKAKKRSASVIYERLPETAGVLSGIFVCFMGNMHFTFYKFIAPVLNKVFKASFDENYIGKAYWYPNATRYIGHHPDVEDKTIHEFPIYSFVLNDLHAHVLNIILVLTILAIVLAFAIRYKDVTEKIAWSKVLNPYVLLVGFYLGVFQGSNFWDFPIYFVTAFAVITFVNMRVHGINILAFIYSACQGLLAFIISKAVIYPFTKDFNKMMSGVGIVSHNSMLHQLIVLWGLPIAICVLGMIFVDVDFRRQHGIKRNSIVNFNDFMHSINIADFYLFIISFCAIGLIIMPEIVYVKDIYTVGYERSNTMFKLTYQAFIMFAICAGYFVPKMLTINTTKLRKGVGVVLSVMLFGCTLYFVEAVYDSGGSPFEISNFKGINSLYHLENEAVFSADKEMCDYINSHIKEKSTVLEANGYSYTDYERMSSATGMPTVIGWRTHEWLWKNDVDVVDARARDVETIYTSNDAEIVSSLVDKYGVDYIYIGELEYSKFSEMGMSVNTDLLMSLYDVEHTVMSKNDMMPSYLLKVKK